MIDINGVSVPFIPASGIDSLRKPQKAIQSNPNGTAPFREIFEEELNRIKFSGHALNRMNSREISLNQSDIKRLEDAVNKAEGKNAKDSLVMMDEKAFIINIPNRTVVTLMTKDKLDDNIITKIDSAEFA